MTIADKLDEAANWGRRRVNHIEHPDLLDPTRAMLEACEDCAEGCYPLYGVAPHECFWRKGPEFTIGQSSLVPHRHHGRAALHNRRFLMTPLSPVTDKLIEELLEALPDITGKSYYWGKLVKRAADQLARHNARDLSGGEVERLRAAMQSALAHRYGDWTAILENALSAMSGDDAGVVTVEQIEAGREAVRLSWSCNKPDEFFAAIYIAMHSARTPVREDVVTRLVEALRKARPYVEQAGFRHHDVSGLLGEIDEALSSVGGEG